MVRILVTDDAKFMRNILSSILTNKGYEIVEASNGQEAVDKALSSDFDLVTLDITMPVMDGISALKLIKAAKPNQRVIMISAMGQKQMIIESIESGAIDFVVKPFDYTKVTEVVSRALRDTKDW